MLEVERKYFSNDVDFTADVNIIGNLKMTGKAQGATVTVAAEDSNTVAVSIQLEDGAGVELTDRASCLAYLSDDATGDSIAATAPDGGVAIGTDGLAIPLIAGKCFLLTSEATGDIDLVVTESGTATWYLILIMPDGSLIASDAITLAA